jgi:hypothetical protein
LGWLKSKIVMGVHLKTLFMYYEEDEFDQENIQSEIDFQNKMWDILLAEPIPVDILLARDLCYDDAILWLN